MEARRLLEERDIQGWVAEVTIWHLFSVMCLFASVAGANDIATSRDVGIAAHITCLVIGTGVGIALATINFVSIRYFPSLVRDGDRSLRVTTLLMMLVLCLGCIFLAIWSGEWAAAKTLRVFGS